MKILPGDNPDLAAQFRRSLENWLQSRSKRLGTLDDLEETVRLRRNAMKITAEDTPDLVRDPNHLGNALQTLDDLEEVIRLARKAMKITPEIG